MKHPFNLQINKDGLRKCQNVNLIPCFCYQDHWGSGKNDYYEGIKIRTLQDKNIINYPKLHKINGEEKNQQTNDYKKIVRIFKNLKKELVNEGYITENLAPSYFIECLIYNISDDCFKKYYFTDILCDCINWLNKNNLANFKCQNKIVNFNGKWTGEGKSNFENKTYSVSIKIHQTLTEISINACFDKSSSEAFNCCVLKENNKEKLIYSYFNNPRNTEERLDKHYGTIILEKTGKNSLQGNYFTDKNPQTKGEFTLLKKLSNKNRNNGTT